MKTILVILSTLLVSLSSCSNPPQDQKTFDLKAIKPIIIENSKKWSEGLIKKDISIISNLYDENAHYLPDSENAIHGNAAISVYWKESMNFLNDIELNMSTLDGTEDLLYETGTGIALIRNQIGSSDTLSYKYLNVWKRQNDGSYKVVIDMFNDVKAN